MGTIVMIALAMMGIGGLAWFIAQGIAQPIGAEKCRIMTRKGEATGEVRGPGITFIPFKGVWNDCVEVPRRFEISTDVEFALPDEKFPTKTSLTLIVELCDDGGEQFNLNGGQEGTTKKVARIAANEIEEFAANPGTEPKNLGQAKKMKNDFVLRAVNELVDDNLLDYADSLSLNDRAKFIKRLEADLSDNGGNYMMPKFGLKLIGFGMGRLVEPPEITDVAKKKEIAKEERDILKENASALKERQEILKRDNPDASFSDIAKALQVQEGKITHNVSEQIVRVESKSGNALDHLVGAAVAAFGKGNSNNSGGKKP
jgi:hypothetical protein